MFYETAGQKGGHIMQATKIEWCNSTWNPVTGCLQGCHYCYAKRIAERFGGCDHPTTDRELSCPLTITRQNGKAMDSSFPFGFEPTFHRYRLEEPQRQKKSKNIFVCSMADLFGPWLPTRWITEVLDACMVAPQHRYLFLTKNPSRYLELNRLSLLPHQDNFWYGSTVVGKTALVMYPEDEKTNAFWSIEPMLGPVNIEKADCLPRWVILGAMTGPGAKKYLPAREWVEEIVDACQWEGIPVFMKDSLVPVWGDDLIRQFPWGGAP